MAGMGLGRAVRCAVVPVAGLGTRFLPATKAVPKELMPVVDRPALQWVVEEARAAGIERFVFVVSRGKEAIADHFDRHAQLEEELARKGKTTLLEAVRAATLAPGEAVFVRQDAPRGLGHAVWCARHALGREPFAVLLPDMLMQGEPGCLEQMLRLHAKVGGNVVAVEEVPREEVFRYGVVAVREEGARLRVVDMVEKPAVERAPSNLIISGRYILQPEIFAALERTTPGAGGEIQITDAMRLLLAEQPFHAMPFAGRTHDTGGKLGFVLANIELALSDPDIGQEVRARLRELLRED